MSLTAINWSQRSAFRRLTIDTLA